MIVVSNYIVNLESSKFCFCMMWVIGIPMKYNEAYILFLLVFFLCYLVLKNKKDNIIKRICFFNYLKY